ncbi:3D (Asp-Asp-Asp) domain-containing protein [Heliophilum fasciatum]|uniref:3D (Asp-Asp-Asp) domain-containing protein n=1 Tax=Heliophilum fasciatum TaxID=35700 RepID=A0A4R2RNT7_9FIRM|nr:3D (Asp-Asp-Asp) domain-containing protein [Heliophilum fasciatum]
MFEPPKPASCTLPNGVVVQFGATVPEFVSETDKLPGDYHNTAELMTVTAYTNRDHGMTGHGITASGERATVGRTVAAGPAVPMGATVEIGGVRYEVEDRGGAIDDGDIDLLVASRREALEFGRRMEPVTVKYVEE